MISRYEAKNNESTLEKSGFVEAVASMMLKSGRLDTFDPKSRSNNIILRALCFIGVQASNITARVGFWRTDPMYRLSLRTAAPGTAAGFSY